jgi:hypothetical protein
MKKYNPRNISILLLSFFVMCTVLLVFASQGITLLELATFVFYAMLSSFVFTITILAAFLHPRLGKAKATLKKIFATSIFHTFDQMFVGVMLFFLLFVIYILLGVSMVMPSTKAILIQLIWVVPPETFIFIVFLPLLLPQVWKVPSWVLAQVIFAGLHVPHYSQITSDAFSLLFMVFIAFMMGCFFYLLYRAGEKFKGLGLVAVMSVHFVWNVMALAAGGTVTTALVWFVRILGIA